MADKDLVRDKELANYRNFYCFPLKAAGNMRGVSANTAARAAKKYPYTRGKLDGHV